MAHSNEDQVRELARLVGITVAEEEVPRWPIDLTA